MFDQDLLDIINTLKTLRIQQQQIIECQQDLTQQLDHILACRGGDTANPHCLSTTYPTRQTLIVTVLPHLSSLVEFHQISATLIQFDHTSLHLLLGHQHVGGLLFLVNTSTSPIASLIPGARPIGSGHHCDMGASTADRFSHVVRPRNLKESGQPTPTNRSGNSIP